MYYLTYRPKTIEEIDNVIPRETIRNILTSKSLPHAFLFVGQKGTGKTSAARIFAKSVNCLSRQSSRQLQIEPCNICAHCKSIDSGSFPDVVEMDAASNRGINEVKNLIRESSFLPIVGKYRIFIIDEAHMITSDGFNALLKTLEEPPSTVIFILATTNPEKVPKTILSRCVTISFGKAKKQELIHMLERIIRLEKILVPSPVLGLIAEHSDSSFRDAAKLLEELVMQNKLEIDTVRGYLGVRSKNNLLLTLNQGSLPKTLSWIEDFSQSGGSFKNLIEELLMEMHNVLLAQNGIGQSNITLTFSSYEITLLMKLLNEAYVNLKNTPIESLPLEIAVVEFYNRKSSK